MFNSKNILKTLGATAMVATLFTGCMTTQLQTQVKTSKSIFLNPVKKSERIVYVDIKNTSGQDLDNLMPIVEKKLQSRGYKLTEDPANAKYILLANVLFANDKKENNAAGGAVAGAALGGGVAGYNNNGAGGTILAGAAGAVVGGLLAKLTEDTIYQMVVDVSIREKTDQKVYNSKNTSTGEAKITDGKAAGFMNSFGGKIRNKNGGGKMDGNMQESNNQHFETNYIDNRTRIFAEATKKDLQLEEALPILEKKIASQIAGIF